MMRNKLFFLFLFQMLFSALSQIKMSPEEIESRDSVKINYSIHGGLNWGILSGGMGPSASGHVHLSLGKFFHPEAMVFFDYHEGKKFLSSHHQTNIGFGICPGIRLNFLPGKNWNPSLVGYIGLVYSEEGTTEPSIQKGFSQYISYAFTNTFYQKYMLSIGLGVGQNIDCIFIKYGVRF